MIQGIQEPTINFTLNNNSVELRMPHQLTPVDVFKYLKEMDFIHTTGKGGDLWMQKGTTSYFTWEQAVTYCLIKPFLNP
jgi:hypothetical protein